MYDLGLVLIGRNLDLLVVGPASLAGLGECGKTGRAAVGEAEARGASEKEPPVSVSGVPGALGAVSMPMEA